MRPHPAKYVSRDFLRNKGPFYWFPYGGELKQILGKAIGFFHNRGIGQRLKALFTLLPHLKTIISGIPLTNIIKSLPRILRK